jgi:ABC-type antimicrobial peptide transport system permease subunit
VGIISKNQEIIDSSSIMSDLGGLDFEYTIPLDNMIMLIDPDTQGIAIDSTENFLSFNEGVSYEEGKETLEKIFSDYGTEIKIGRLSDRIDEIMTRTDWILNRFSASAVVFLVLSVLSILSIQMMSFFTRKEEIGIWVSNGLEHKDIFQILLIENLIKILVSYAVSLGIFIFVLKLNNVSGSQMYYLREVLFVYGPLIVLTAGIAIAVGVCMISVIYIRRKTIPDIINGNW